jgi:hypothetical protein
LGDDSAVKRLPDIFRRPEFADNLAESLKNRCEQGEYEAWEYSGEQLVLSLIGAQDFYCFHRRFAPFLEQTLVTAVCGCKLPLRIWFDKWWEVCEVSRLNEDAVQMIKNFRKVFPIPEEECLPVISTPIAEWQYALHDYLYKDVKPFVISVKWNKDSTGNITIPSGTFSIERKLDDQGILHISVTEVSGKPMPVNSIRISYVPAFRDADKATRWSINLKRFSPAKRNDLLNEPLVVQLADGIIIQCF